MRFAGGDGGFWVVDGRVRLGISVNKSSSESVSIFKSSIMNVGDSWVWWCVCVVYCVGDSECARLAGTKVTGLAALISIWMWDLVAVVLSGVGAFLLSLLEAESAFVGVGFSASLVGDPAFSLLEAVSAFVGVAVLCLLVCEWGVVQVPTTSTSPDPPSPFWFSRTTLLRGDGDGAIVMKDSRSSSSFRVPTSIANPPCVRLAITSCRCH